MLAKAERVGKCDKSHVEGSLTDAYPIPPAWISGQTPAVRQGLSRVCRTRNRPDAAGHERPLPEGRSTVRFKLHATPHHVARVQDAKQWQRVLRRGDTAGREQKHDTCTASRQPLMRKE